MAAPLDVLSDPNFAEYLKRAMTAQPAPGFEEALAEDKASRDRAGLQTGLSQAAALLRNQNVPTLQSRPQDDGMKAWVARQAATNQAQDAALKPLEIAARFRALKGGENGPGATPAETTPDEILVNLAERRGLSGAEADALRPYPKTALEMFKAPDKEDTFAPPTDDQVKRGKATGVSAPAARESSVQYEGRISAAAKDKAGRDSQAGASTIELRKEFKNDEVVKATTDLHQAITKIRKMPENGFGDIGLIYSYIKILDPGSVVKEGEVALSREPTPLLSKLQIAYSKAANGRVLDAALIRDLKATAEAEWGAQMDAYQSVEDYYRGLATDVGVKPEHVIVKYGYQRKQAAVADPLGIR
jgi:hypothetical protein